MIGGSVWRNEVGRVVAGVGGYVDDTYILGVLHVAVVRSPHAHARIINVVTERALMVPGVVAVVVARDYPEFVPQIQSSWRRRASTIRTAISTLRHPSIRCRPTMTAGGHRQPPVREGVVRWM